MLFITNSMPMITEGSITVKTVDPMVVKSELMKGCVSLISSQELSDVCTAFLGITVAPKQMDIAPRVGEDTVLLVQSSIDLPAGTKVLPTGAILNFSVIRATGSPNTTVTEDVAKISNTGIGLLRKLAKKLI